MSPIIDALSLNVDREGERWHLALRVQHPEGGDGLPKLARELLVAGLKSGGFAVTDMPTALVVEKRFATLADALAEAAAPLQGIRTALHLAKK